MKTAKDYVRGKKVYVNCFERQDLGRRFFQSIPFGFKIQHKEDSFRELTICHPRNQIQPVDLYDRFKELILYYGDRSPFT